jgi:hypothetical protein
MNIAPNNTNNELIVAERNDQDNGFGHAALVLLEKLLTASIESGNSNESNDSRPADLKGCFE